MFSAFKAAVELTEDPRTHLNDILVDYLGDHSDILICGQARSHCVNLSTRDLVDALKKRESKSHVHMLWDASSPVEKYDYQDQSAQSTRSDHGHSAWDEHFHTFLKNNNMLSDCHSAFMDVTSTKNATEEDIRR